MPLRLKARRLVALGAIGACLSPCNQAWGQTHPVPTQGTEAPIRLDQIQVIGSHNSYHAGLTAERLAEIAAVNPDLAALLDYRHASLTQQLDAGVRQIELDLYADDKGGRFARPHRPGRPDIVWPLAPSARAVMERPGIKVMHIPDLDQHATCLTLSTCLKEVTSWSQAHPHHIPIFIILETEQRDEVPGGTSVQPFTRQTFDALDATIRAAIPADRLLTPDDLHTPGETLSDAIAARGWPALSKTLGKIIFLLDQRHDGPAYLQGHPGLKGRIAFPNADPHATEAAFTELNDGPEQQVTALVKHHLLVRIRADADTKEGRSGAIGRRDMALRSGAQLISTDYPDSEPARWSGYRVGFPNGRAARCNPVTVPEASAACRDEALSAAASDAPVLTRLVLVMRHGIRSALSGQQPDLATLPANWPHWAGRPGDLTLHGADALSSAGKSLRQWLEQNALLQADLCPASGSILIHANSEPRTIASAHSIAEGLAPSCALSLHHLAEFKPDALFSPQQTSPALFDTKRLSALLPDPERLSSRQKRELSLLGSLLHCTPHHCDFLHEPSRIQADHTGRGFVLSGPIAEASSYAEVLELGYLDGHPLPDLNGKPFDTETLESLSGLHATMLASTLQPTPIAAPLSQMLRKALAENITASDGPVLTLYMGHDDTIAPLLGMLDSHVKAPGYARDEIPVGSALGFALYRNADGSRHIRVVFISQSPEDIRRDPNRAPLSWSYPRVPACHGKGGTCTMPEFLKALHL